MGFLKVAFWLLRLQPESHLQAEQDISLRNYMAEQSMSLWKDREHKEAPTAEWFASLLRKSGFDPENIWTQGPTYLARAGSFVFRLEPDRDYIEAAGPVASGVRVALMKRNAQKLTDLYEDGLSVVFKSPNALQAFNALLSQGEELTKVLRQRMAMSYARGEQETRRGPHVTLHQKEDFPLAHAGGLA